MRSHKKYDHNFTLALQIGSISYNSVRSTISKSTYYHLLNYNLSSLFGYEYRDFQSQLLPLVKTFAHSRKLIITITILCHVYRFYKKIQDSLIHKPSGYLDNIQNMTVKAVYFLSNRFKIPIERACRFFKLKLSTFYNWAVQVKARCLISPIHKCPKVWPNQVSGSELNIMKKFLLDPKYTGWPVHAVHSEAVRLKALFIGRGSWYKYSRLFGFTGKRFKKPRQSKGIRAFRPNEIIHADITCLKLLDGLTAYIYLIADNFSRFVISYKVSLRVSAEIALSNLKDAYSSIVKKQSDTIDPYIIFLTDGGPENDNDTIKQYLEDKITIKHLIAQKHIRFSNSMIEAVNKSLKYSWLFLRQYRDLNDLDKYLEKVIHEYNHVRPHHAHQYQTPAEAYSGKLPDLDFIRSQFELARLRRIQENRIASCPICQF